MNTQEIPVSESELAHPGKRYQGQFIDGIVCVGIFVSGGYIVRLLGYESDVGMIAVVLISFSYFVFSDALPNGQSIGKMVLGLGVVSRSTRKPCSVLQSFVRNIFTPLLGIIDAVLIFGKSRQRLGDYLANTVVIDLRKIPISVHD